MKLWLDISRKRHAAVVCALVKVLEARNHHFVITSANEDLFSHLSAELAPHTVTILTGSKSRGTLARAFSAPMRVARLASWARQHSFDLALCLDNPTQATSSRLIGLSVAALLENPSDRGSEILRRASSFIGVPDYLTTRQMSDLNIAQSQIIWRYEDAPEAVYYDGFKSTPTSRQDLFRALNWAIPDAYSDAPLVVYRPPNTPHSKRQVSNIFHALQQHHCVALVLTSDVQFSRVHCEDEFPELKILPPQEDSRRLLSHSDLVLSHSTTLVKEATVVETPACWISKNKPKNRLLHLIDDGKIRHVTALTQALKAPPLKRQNPAPQVVSHLASDLVTQLESFHELSSRTS